MHTYICIHTYAYIRYTVRIVDTYMIAVCINVYMIMFSMYITALGCFDGYARAETLISYRLRIDYGQLLLCLLIAVTET